MINIFGKRCGKSIQCYEGLLKTLQNKDVTSVVLYSRTEGEIKIYSQQYVDNLEAKIKEFEATEEYNYNNYQTVMNRVAKAIEYIKENEKEYGSLEENEKIILDILKGKEIEIPQFEGTLEQLEKLSIRGNND